MKTIFSFRSQAVVSLPFFAFGLASFAVLLAWTLRNPEVLRAPAAVPHSLGVAHLSILGWLLPFVFGAVYQLVPVIAEARLWSRGLAYLHFGLHAVAAPHFVARIMSGDSPSAARWGAIVAAGVVVGVVNLLVTASRRSRWLPESIGMLMALFWLTMTVALGVVLALAKVGAVTSLAPDRILRLHVAAGLVGFFLATLIAVSFKLVPMFLLGAVRSRAGAWSSIVTLNAGLMLAVPGLLGGFRWIVVASALCVALAVALYLVEMTFVPIRSIRPLDWAMCSFFLGAAMLIPTTVTGVLAVLGREGFEVWQPARPGNAVFVLGVLGVLTPCVLGMAGRILPFLTWQWRYADHLGRARVPLVSDLAIDSLHAAQFFCFVVAAAAFIVGTGTDGELWTRAGLTALTGAAVLQVANIAHLARHVLRPRMEPIKVNRATADMRQPIVGATVGHPSMS